MQANHLCSKSYNEQEFFFFPREMFISNDSSVNVLIFFFPAVINECVCRVRH